MWSLTPRKPPPLAGEVQCFCPCHADGAENAAAINGLVTPGVARVDPVGAATACARCLPFHCVALSGTPAELGYRPRAKKPAPPPAGEWKDDASGSTFHAGGGDGPE
jgi:hypothetical protein